MMSTHKLTAGDGYLYLIRQTAAADGDKGRASLSDYYSSKGESPGRWVGRGLAGLATPVGRGQLTDAAAQLWTVEPGSRVTEDQMKALFGLGLHPNAKQVVDRLIECGAAAKPALEAAKLGRPFHINDGVTELQRRLAVAYRDYNLGTGGHWNAPIPDEVRAIIRTGVARDMFEEEHARAPADDRELSGYIACHTRELTTSVAGYDLTFTPVKSVSALWAIAPIEVAKRIEECHDRAVADALEYLQDNAAFTRIGSGGIAQIDSEGFIAALFTHRDSRAGDPGLHSHVTVSNKVRAIGADGILRWLALDGRPLFKATVAASELYNTRIEGYLSDALGVRFAERGGGARGKRPVREIVGIPTDLTELWSTRRAAIAQRYAELAKQFQADHGREPTTPEAIALSQQATLETRSAKHEPRSWAEQRQQWHTQAIELLGSQQALTGLIGRVLTGRRSPAAHITDEWIGQQAADVIRTVSQSRASWQRTHIYAEAQRRIRAHGHATNPALADAITDAALQAPLSLPHARVADTDLGEPDALRRRDGSSIYSTHGTALYTSGDIIAAERRIVAAAQRYDGRRAPAEAVDIALLAQAARGRHLNAGQQALVRDLAGSGARVGLALAPAGTGKTTAMATLARAWEECGGRVVGLAPSADAAQVLREEIRVDATDTVAKYLWLDQNPNTSDHARSWFDRVDDSTLIIIDEAGKAGTLELDAVIGHALARAASVRLIGDDKQLASISAGGVLRDIADTSGALTLSQVVRFRSRSEAVATLAVRDGDPAGIAFYADHHRIHVAAESTAADMAYSRWRADCLAGHDSVLLAPTNEMVAELNDRARLDRLRAAADDPHTRPSAEIILADQLRASAGDIVCTRRNARWLRLGRADFVRNGYRWRVDAVGADGALRVSHLTTGQKASLAPDYVRQHVTLGYAATIDSRQGVTADTCHIVGSDTLSRQMLYVALTRGRHRNDIYLSTVEADPHRILTPKATQPATAVDVLTRALARDEAHISATTADRIAKDPFTRLGPAAAIYLDEVAEAAQILLGAQEMASIDRHADAIYAGLTRQPAWPILRKHLALLAVCGHDPRERLAFAAQQGELSDAADIAAVLDWRLDPSGTHSAGTGPLRWLPGIPAALSSDPAWDELLRARHDLIVELADSIRASAVDWTVKTAPRWARPLLAANPKLVAEIAVFRAACAVSPADTRITGPEQYPTRTRAIQQLLENAAAAAVGRRGADTSRYNTVVDDINPHIRRDPYWPQLAAHLATAARSGVDIRQLLDDATAQGPLPTELPAAALWWRLAGTLSPAILETPQSRLRPDWITDVHTVFGTALAEAIAADPAWPVLVAAVNTTDPRRWRPLDLLRVAAEHLHDAQLDPPLRPDEYARLLTYSIDLFTTEHPFDHDIPTPHEPPLTPEEDEELRHHTPDPLRPHTDPLDGVGIETDTSLGEFDELAPPDSQDYRNHGDQFGGLRFEDLSSTRPADALKPTLANVSELRAQYQDAFDTVAALRAQVISGHGPAMRQVVPQILQLRKRADADRPYMLAVQAVIAEWSDAEEQYEQALAQVTWARDQLAALQTQPDVDPLDIASARADLALRRMYLPDITPAERYLPALTTASAARAEAAGGAEHIVTEEDVQAARTRAGDAALRAARQQRDQLHAELDRAETQAALAFAEAEARGADHVTEQIAALHTELDILEQAGEYHPTAR